MQPRTRRQKEVLDYITQFVERNGYEPSYQQIARQLGVRSKGGIQRHISALESQGLILRRRINGNFSIQLSDGEEHNDAASSSVEFIRVDNEFHEESRTRIDIPGFLLGSLAPAETLAVAAFDDSLLDQHICEDDIILFERRNYARRGQTVLITVADELRVGQFHNKGTEVELRPANPDFEALTFPADEISILGVMRGLIRSVPPQMQ